MPTFTTNYDLSKPLVNNAVDQDLWGNELNDDLDSIDTLLKSGITIAPQSSQTIGFTATASISIKYLYPCDATGGAFAATLPAAATAEIGATVYIKKTDSSTNAITVTRSGSDTIDGANTYVINIENQTNGFISDGTSKWYVLTEGMSAVPDATTSVKGIVQLATNSEVTTGTSASLISPVSSMIYHRGISKAWSNFNGTGSPASRDALNFSSITDNGTGVYTGNFTTAMANPNYVTFVSTETQSSNTNGILANVRDGGTYSTAAVQIAINTPGGVSIDKSYIGIIVFGDR